MRAGGDAVRKSRVRLEALEAMGGRCVCCGECRPEFLVFDHRLGGGTAERKREPGLKGAGMAYRLRKMGYPGEYQVLCASCNQATKDGKMCPHQIEMLVHGCILDRHEMSHRLQIRTTAEPPQPTKTTRNQGVAIN